MNSKYFEKLKMLTTVCPDKLDTFSREDIEYMNLQAFTQRTIEKQSMSYGSAVAFPFALPAQKSISSYFQHN